MKFKGHESFFIRKGWLYKGLNNVRINQDVFIAKDAMEVLGLGSNMVKSLRYWMQATGLTTEPHTGRRHQHLTPFGEIIGRNDPYLEELGTLWLIHLNLAMNRELATAWYEFFNEFNMQEFQKDDFVLHLKKRSEAAQSSFESDFECIVNTYIPKSKSKGKVDPENNIDCPLGELGLIDFVDRKKKIYKKSAPGKNMLHPLIFLSAILRLVNGKKEVRIRDLLFGTSEMLSAGKIFQLDTVALLKLLYDLEKLDKLEVIRTAGLDIVRIQEDITEEQCIEEYYHTLDA